MDLSGDWIWSLFSPVTSALCFIIGLFLLKASKGRPEMRMAIGLLFMFSIGAALDTAMSFSPNKDMALLFGRAVIFVAEMCIATVFYLSLTQLPAKLADRVIRRRREFFIVIAIIATLIGLTVSKISYDRWGYSINISLGLSLAITAYILLAFASIGVLIYSSTREGDRDAKVKTAIICLALPMPLIYSIVTTVIEDVTRTPFPRPLMPGFTIMVLLVAFAIWRYKLFIAVPAVCEEMPLAAPKVTNQTQLGRTYLVESKKSTMAYELLVDDLAKGAHGLIITREHPEQVRETWGLQTTPILWLSSNSGKDRIDPTNLSIIQHTVIEHLKRGERPIVLLDGLEYIFSNNKEEKVLQLVLSLRDEIIVSQGKLILPVDPLTMEPRTLAYIERDLEIVMHGE